MAKGRLIQKRWLENWRVGLVLAGFLLLGGLLGGLIWGLETPAAQAADFCRPWHGQQICILKIQRSAKKHWEFRATVAVDGVERPRSAYNCRRRIWVGLDGIRHVFDPHGPGELICSLLNRDDAREGLSRELMLDRAPRLLQPRTNLSSLSTRSGEVATQTAIIQTAITQTAIN
ncbi:hypothetical protein H6F46_11065 [Limnothrix sp. FACHB-1083]|uniref:hypothetical protein n=1 Tax=unclassified Limnothrix TaxID=2632864 RepID=UPI001680B11E|nr:MULTISPECIES: hypothetical protein [unclassified Limnothrix]MBD2161231.1 hypothetical protein [Limnothrix sp. FACHB-1083]MBD2192405.1 hypothetical protein [Limnothrix sp. FACHB-1088]